jgi:hypothetical protein
MAYLVFGSNSIGALSYGRNTAAEAVGKAAELLALGFSIVQIMAPDGRVYLPWEFSALLADQDQLKVARNPMIAA